MAPRKYTTAERICTFWSKVDKSNGDDACWLWTGSVRGYGYGQFWFNSRNRPTHRISWELAHGEIPDGLLVCHRCDNPICVNPKHLFLGTQQDNIDDKTRKGRQAIGDRNGVYTHPEKRPFGERNARYTHPENTAHGEAHGRHKLTELQVREIRQLYIEKGISQRQLARMFGITKTHVRRIVRGENWKHIE